MRVDLNKMSLDIQKIERLFALKKDLEHRLVSKNIKGINIFNNDLVFVDFVFNDIKIALDITLENKIFLVFRDIPTQAFFSFQWGVKNESGTELFNGHKFVIDPFKQIQPSTDIGENVEAVITCLTQELKTGHYHLLKIKDQLNDLWHRVKCDAENRVWGDMIVYFKDRLLTIPETLKRIRDEKLNIARFGDGEIRCMTTANGCFFQTHDWKLTQELRDICLTQSDLLVCYPSPSMGDDWWQKFWLEFWFRSKYYLNQSQLGDAFITRPEAFYLFGDEVVELWQQIFDNQKACFVTGSSSRLDVDHVIFSTLASKSKITSKNNNAYECIDTIMEQCLAKKDEVDMFLIALGPTGTALAARLAKQGIRVLDIGHLNNSYDTVFLGKGTPESIQFEEH